MESLTEQKPIFSINLFRFDKFNSIPIFMIGFMFSLLLVPIYGMWMFFERDRPLLALGLFPLIPLFLSGIFFMAIPMTKNHWMNVYPDRLEEVTIFFRTLKTQHIIPAPHYYDDLRIYPTKLLFLFDCYAFKDLRYNSIRFIAPDIAVQLMNHIRQVVGEEKWQEIYRKE